MDVDDLEVAQDEGNKEAIVQMILDLASACSIGGARGGGWQANPLIPERIDSCNSGDSPVICSQYNWQHAHAVKNNSAATAPLVHPNWTQQDGATSTPERITIDSSNSPPEDSPMI